MFGSRNTTRFAHQLNVAFRRGTCTNKGTHTRLEFNGTVQHIVSFNGDRKFVTGLLTCYHWDHAVLAVDFTKDVATDFGWSGFSMTTTHNISEWLGALQSMRFIQMVSLSKVTWMPLWTIKGPKNKTHREILNAKFAMGAPWVKTINGCSWFYGTLFDKYKVQHAMHVNAEIIGDGISWHWFTADWVDGVWTKRFIDEDAEKRFHKNVARRNAAHDRVAA